MWHLHVRQSILIQGDEIFVWAIKTHYKQNRSDFKLYTKMYITHNGYSWISIIILLMWQVCR